MRGSMRNFIFHRGTRIVFGGGCVREYLASFAREYGPNVLLASGERSARHSGVYAEVRQTLRRAGKAGGGVLRASGRAPITPPCSGAPGSPGNTGST